MSDIYANKSFHAPISYAINEPIIAYDISKANISVLRDQNILSEEEYIYLYNAPKLERSVAIGKMQLKDKSVTKALDSGIANAKRVFLKNNRISDSNILAIRNDSITVIGLPMAKNLAVTDRVKFHVEGVYTSYYQLRATSKAPMIEILYNYDPVSGSEVFDVKGIGDDQLELHRNHMVRLLANIFYTAQSSSMISIVRLLSNIYRQYICLAFDLGVYREFNARSAFRLKKEFSTYSTIYTDYAEFATKDIIDISYNESILRQINRIFASMYFGGKK